VRRTPFKRACDTESCLARIVLLAGFAPKRARGIGCAHVFYAEPHVRDPEPGPLVIRSPRRARGGVTIMDDVKFQGRCRRSQRLVEFEDVVIGVEPMPNEGVHTSPIGRPAANVS